MTTLAEALAAALLRHADHAFALMGNGNAHLIDALVKAGMPLTEVRHEVATVASADSTIGSGVSFVVSARTTATITPTSTTPATIHAHSGNRRQNEAASGAASGSVPNPSGEVPG